MGPIDSPPIPTAWLVRPATPTSPGLIGLELVGKTNQQGAPAIYWGKGYAECYKLAEADGWKL